MTSSPDLIHELRASRPSAPADLRARIQDDRGRAACSALRGRAGASRSAAGCSSQFRRQRRSRSQARASSGSRVPTRRRPSARTPSRSRRSEAAAPSTTADQSAGRAQTPVPDDHGRPGAAGERDPHRRGEGRRRRLARRAERTRAHAARSEGYVVSSSVATGDEGSASIVVRVPVDEVQDAITGLSGLGRIVSQQVTTADRQESIDAAQRDSLAPCARSRVITARLESETLDARDAGHVSRRA